MFWREGYGRWYFSPYCWPRSSFLKQGTEKCSMGNDAMFNPEMGITIGRILSKREAS
jgi:hypothetical protein